MSTPTSAPQEFQEHLRRQGFILGGQLGRGSLGTVYAATQRSLGRPVAVKFLTGFGHQAPHVRKRFNREAPLLARIQHPNIPYVITRGEVEGKVPYFVMQYISGKALNAIIEHQKLGFAQAIAICEGILSALDKVHGCDVIHRDIKPDNIIVQDDHVWLIDFSLGFCRQYSPGLSRPTLPETGLGDERYASPEQKKDAANVDARSDIYSTGVVLFEMLTGRTKLPPKNTAEFLRPGVPAALGSIIEKASALVPENRYSSAQEFAEALATFSSSISAGYSWTGVAVCPTPGCELGTWSERGYFRGPFVSDALTHKHCRGCGGELIRSCPGCGRPLASDINELVTTKTKSGPDNTQAHCEHCGHLLYRTPKCNGCGSLLRKGDLSGASFDDCEKCRAHQADTTPYDPADYVSNVGDDDLPF